MFVLNVVLAISAVLWTVTSGGLIMYDPKHFLFEVMENDAMWAELLNIGIKIETCIVSPSARTVLHEMGMITVDIRKLCRTKEAFGYGSSNHEKMLKKFKARREMNSWIMSQNMESNRVEDLFTPLTMNSNEVEKTENEMANGEVAHVPTVNQEQGNAQNMNVVVDKIHDPLVTNSNEVEKTKNEMANGEGAHVPTVIHGQENAQKMNVVDDKNALSLGTEIEPEKPVDKTVVTISALHVLTHIISTHYMESDALEFGLSVVASAIKCHVLQIISIMLRAIAEETISDYKSTWYSNVWGSLELYIDKIAWLRETLAIEGALYREWENLTLHTNANKLKLAMDELEFIRELVDESLYTACEHSSHDQIAEILKFNSETDTWAFPKGIRSIFNKSEKKIQNVFQSIPINTMEPKAWANNLNKMETYYKILSRSP